MFKQYLEDLLAWVLKVLRPLIYLPNVTPLKALFSSEIFPWAFVYSFRKKLTLPIGYVIFLVYMLISAAFILNQGVRFLVPARALFALLNATLIFFLIIKVDDEEFGSLKKVFTWVFGINVVLSLVQYFGMLPPSCVCSLTGLLTNLTDLVGVWPPCLQSLPMLHFPFIIILPISCFSTK